MAPKLPTCTSLLLFLSGLAAQLRADSTDCRYYLEGGPFLAGSKGQKITLRCDSAVTLYGFSFGLNYDEEMLKVTGVTNIATAAAGADYFDGTIDGAKDLLGFGCIFDTSGSFLKKLSPGSGQALAILTVDVLAVSDGQTTLSFESVQTQPPSSKPVKNIMADSEGFSIVPVLANGTLAIETRVPVIASIENNAGLAGKVFQVSGRFLDEPGLAVKV